MTRIYARNCEVVIVSKQTEEQFINENHYQGYLPSQVCYALTDGNQVVEMMTFGIPRYNKAYDWELLRLCTKKDYQVVGGASKLLKAFTDNYKGSIISYCNESKFNGGVYEALGFTKTSTCKSYHYEKDGKSYHRSRFQRWRLEKMFPQYPRSEYTEAQVMELEGYTRVNEVQSTWVLGAANDKWYIYKITLDDGCTYIGQHRYHNDTNDNYSGSGLLLKRKQKTHKWTKEILIDNITSQEEADSLEERCIAVDRLENEDNINICDGGHGYVGNGVSKAFWTDEEKETINSKISVARIAYYETHPEAKTAISERRKTIEANMSKEAKENRANKISEGLKAFYAIHDGPNKGKPGTPHTQEFKESLRQRMTGLSRTQEQKEAISRANKGRKHTQEWKEHNSEILKEQYANGRKVAGFCANPSIGGKANSERVKQIKEKIRSEGLLCAEDIKKHERPKHKVAYKIGQITAYYPL